MAHPTPNYPKPKHQDNYMPTKVAALSADQIKSLSRLLPAGKAANSSSGTGNNIADPPRRRRRRPRRKPPASAAAE